MNYLSLKGTPKEIGFQCGKYFADRGFNLAEFLPPTTEERKEYSQSVKMIYETECSSILEEIQGLAEGNQCDEETLRTFLLSMYAYTPMNFCTCITGMDDRGHLLLGRNSDFLIAAQSMYSQCVVKPKFGYAFIGNTTGFVEMEDGINEKGFAVGLTFIFSHEKQRGLNAGMIIRLLLERCASVKEAISLLQRMKIGTAQTLTLADRKGNRAVVECNPHHVEVNTSDRVLYSVNQFVSGSMKRYNPHNIDDMESGLRLQTCRKALNHQLFVTLYYLKEILSGRHGFLCQYDRSLGGDTVWSVIYDLTAGTMEFCDGNPSKEDYLKKKIEFK